MYQALYRKWRPRTFDDVVGQEHITETLKNQVNTGRLSHAYLFIGTRGTGKTTCAKILAKAVNCEHPVNGNPCNECRFCRGIDDGSIMDVVEMDAASNNGVDNVRALRDEAIFSPAAAKKRVYIIDEVHMLSTSAFNALLKILEEPPEHLMFILATTELNKVPPTILSRCQRHSFKRLDTQSITGRLSYVAEQEGLDLRPDAAGLIASLSEGGMRDALSMLDQCSGRQRIDADTVYSAMGLAGNREIALMLKCVAGHDTPAAIQLFRRLWQDGKDPSVLLGELSALQRDVLMKIVAPNGGMEIVSGGYDEAVLSEFAARFRPGELINNINIIQRALFDMKSGQAKTVCELCLITLCEPDIGDDLPMLRERVARLESAVKHGAATAPPEIKAPSESPAPKPAETEGALRAPDNDIPFDIDPPTSNAVAEPMPAEPPAALTPEPPAVKEPAAAAPGDGQLWERVKAAVAGKMPMGLYTILTDPVQVAADMEGGALVIKVESGFAMNMLNRPDITSLIAASAGETLGHPVSVLFEEAGQPADGAAASGNTDKLDGLGRFGVVKFK